MGARRTGEVQQEENAGQKIYGVVREIAEEVRVEQEEETGEQKVYGLVRQIEKEVRVAQQEDNGR